MIESIADFLNELKSQEASKLKEVNISHGPTIGEMYEELSIELLNRAIPASLGLSVVSGFIDGGTGILSGQIDCMLVRGEGLEIPRTRKYVWHVRDVIVVLEIKKNLYGNDLRDAFHHLADVKKIERQFEAAGGWDDPSADLHFPFRVYAQITGRKVPYVHELSAASSTERVILNTIVSEHLGCIRVIFGYSGFRNEKNFRASFYETLREQEGVSGYGVGIFPHLIISGDYAMVKANGMPFLPPAGDRENWNVLCSTKASNPLLLLLEFVWTRLDLRFGIGGWFGEDLQNHVFHSFFSTRLVKNEERRTNEGRHTWELTYHDWSSKALKGSTIEIRPWEPVHLDDVQAEAFEILADGGEINTKDPAVLAWLAENNRDPKIFWEGLLDTRLVATRGSLIEPINDFCELLVLPNGQWVAGDNDGGRLTRWFMNKLAELNAGQD